MPDPSTLTVDDLLDHLRALDGVVVEVASEASGAPSAAWGDVFAYHDPSGDTPPEKRFPFATIVMRDTDGAQSLLDRPGVYRLNIGVGRSRFTELLAFAPSEIHEQSTRFDYTALDRLLPHPIYAAQSWISILNPGRDTTNIALQLLGDARAREEARTTTGSTHKRSPQTLSETDRRIVAAWAADCVEHVLHHFENEAPGSGQPRAAVERARSYSGGELDTAQEIRQRFTGGSAARHVQSPAAVAVARASGQLSAVPHMGAHALGAAAYAVKAAGLAGPDQNVAIANEIQWQLAHLTPQARMALQQLPAIGTHASGPLGKGLLATGLLGEIVTELQQLLAGPATEAGRLIS